MILKDITPDYSLTKAQTVMPGNPNAFIDLTMGLDSFRVKPNLLSTLLSSSISTQSTRTNAFMFDMTSNSLTLPDGKPYGAKGNDVTKDGYSSKWYTIPSFGLRWNVSPLDYMNKRKPHTTEMMDAAYVVSMMTEKAESAFGLLDELGLGTLLTTDTNIVRGGPFTEYNFYTELTGGARPAKTDMQLTDAVEHEELFRAEKHKLTQKLMMAGLNSAKFVCICGDTFFNDRYSIEAASGLNREIRNALDPASMQIPSSAMDGTSYNYDNFTGARDGILYINYGSSIIAGTKIIADTDAYLLPMGVSEMIVKVYAPATTQTYVNTEGLPMYSWTTSDEWSGITTVYESNFLIMNKFPQLITALKNT